MIIHSASAPVTPGNETSEATFLHPGGMESPEAPRTLKGFNNISIIASNRIYRT